MTPYGIEPATFLLYKNPCPLTLCTRCKLWSAPFYATCWIQQTL